MSFLDGVRALKRKGLASEALQLLGTGGSTGRERIEAEVLRVELLETAGHYDSARMLAAKLMSSSGISAAQKSACEYILGRIAMDLGPIEDSIIHLQRAAMYAQDANDLEAEFNARAQILFLADGVASNTLLAELRSLATRVGDSQCTARLHLFVAMMEAKRGLMLNARRHLKIASQLLRHASNVSLEALAQNVWFGIAIVEADYETARVHGSQCVQLAEKAGLTAILRAALGNLGSLYLATGDTSAATEFLTRAVKWNSAHRLGHQSNAALEGLARVYLAEGRLEECGEALDVVQGSSAEHGSYCWREAELTRAQMHAAKKNPLAALEHLESVLGVAELVGDRLMTIRATLTKAALLGQSSSADEALTLLAGVVPELVGRSPELFAQAEQIFATLIATTGDQAAAADHFSRASRICKVVGCVTTERALASHWNSTSTNAYVDRSGDRDDLRTGRHATCRSVHALTSALAHASRPRIVAEELNDLLVSTGCVVRSSVASYPISEPPTDRAAGDEWFLEVGRTARDVVGLLMEAQHDPESIATMTSLQIFADSIRQLVSGRVDVETHATLWPVEELPIEGDSSVSAGQMRELLTYARRIAKTDVTVLITGESGTGKEILARAIHNCSHRADLLFVPFNCAAIPRDLLESQLFGHRRGAFTGADRDHLGLIRSARGGTIFLDEIGELSLDMQPKLLRFLESGEVATLGELQPQKSDVRVIAATNTNLEEAVRSGRFREDLFYRLNVVRLAIRPLRERRDEIPGLVHHFVARASEEFKKGRILITDDAMERLLLYRWPGNIRQLQNEIRRMVALADADSTLTPSAIHPEILGAEAVVRHEGVNGSELSIPLRAKLTPTLARVECEIIRAALKEHGGKVNAAAKALGISRKGLYLKRQRFGL